jgi:hypothetical protein
MMVWFQTTVLFLNLCVIVTVLAVDRNNTLSILKACDVSTTERLQRCTFHNKQIYTNIDLLSDHQIY